MTQGLGCGFEGGMFPMGLSALPRNGSLERPPSLQRPTSSRQLAGGPAGLHGCQASVHSDIEAVHVRSGNLLLCNAGHVALRLLSFADRHLNPAASLGRDHA